VKAVVIACPRCGASFSHPASSGLDAVCTHCGADFRVDHLDGVPGFVLRQLALADERRKAAAGGATAEEAPEAGG